MSRSERLARIASKMSHPSMNPAHAFRLLTDGEVEVEKAGEAHIKHEVSVSPDRTPEQVAHGEWVQNVRTAYAAGLLN